MVQYEDYYEILGVSRKATDAEIKKAFRKLAREHHPDRNPQNKEAAEAKFKKINEAHTILSNPEKRAQYDQLGRIPHGSEFKPPPGFDFNGMNFGGGGANNFADLFNTIFSQGGQRSRGGSSPFDNFGGGSRSHGFGGGPAAKGSDVNSNLELNLEDAFKGCTKKLNFGRLGTLEVKIPAGVKDGGKIRLTGKGNPSQMGGEPGDLYLTVKLQNTKDFSLHGDNIESKVYVSFTEAVFGCTKSIKTLTGSAEIKIPAGVNSGQKLKLSQKGWPSKTGKGDHLVQIMIQSPKELSEKEKKLFEELRKLENEKE